MSDKTQKGKNKKSKLNGRFWRSGHPGFTGLCGIFMINTVFLWRGLSVPDMRQISSTF